MSAQTEDVTTNTDILNGECFKNTECKLSKGNTKVTLTEGHRKNAYGNISINSTSATIHYWKFKIGRISGSGAKPAVGIVETSVEKSIGIFMSDGRGYAADAKGYLLFPGKEGYESTLGGLSFRKGDILNMSLDLTKKVLLYQLNDDDQRTKQIKNIKIGVGIRYKLAVFLGEKNDYIQLIAYHEEKNNKKSDKNESIEREEKKEEIKSEEKDMMNKLQSQLMEKEKLLTTKQNEMKQKDVEMEEYKIMVEQLQDQLLLKIQEIDDNKSTLQQKETQLNETTQV